MTGIEVGLLGLVIGILGVGGGRMWAGKQYLTKGTHELLCTNASLRFEKKLHGTT